MHAGILTWDVCVNNIMNLDTVNNMLALLLIVYSHMILAHCCTVLLLYSCCLSQVVQ